MIKILGVKTLYSVQNDAWCGDAVSFNVCRWCVDVVMYWLPTSIPHCALCLQPCVVM